MIEVRQSDGLRAEPAHRLTIGSLLLWTLGTALSLAIARWELGYAKDATPQMMAYWNAHIVAFSPLHGISIAFLMLALSRRWKGFAAIPSAPGHWYLAFQGASLVIGWLADVLRLTRAIDVAPPLRGWYGTLWPTAIFAIPTLLALVGSIRVRGSFWWRAMLVLLAVPGIAVIAHAWIQTPLRRWNWLISEFGDGTLDRAVWSLPAVAALIAALVDRQLQRTHDVLHWIGIGSLCLAIALQWPFWLWWWQVFR